MRPRVSLVPPASGSQILNARRRSDCLPPTEPCLPASRSYPVSILLSCGRSSHEFRSLERSLLRLHFRRHCCDKAVDVAFTIVRVDAVLSPPLENGSFRSAPPHLLSPSGSTRHRSRRRTPPQGRLTRPIHRPSCAEAHSDGTLAVTSRARCTRAPVWWCVGGARLPGRVLPSHLHRVEHGCSMGARGEASSPLAEAEGLLAPLL
jgi:hypothetical protein